MYKVWQLSMHLGGIISCVDVPSDSLPHGETRGPTQTDACHETRKAHQGLYKPPLSPPHAVKIQSTPATSRSPGFPGTSRTTNCACRATKLQASPMAPLERADCCALPASQACPAPPLCTCPALSCRSICSCTAPGI